MQQAQHVLALRDGPFSGRDLRARRMDQLLRLADIEAGSGAALVAQFDQIQAVLRQSQGLLADLQFEVLFQKLEIAFHHVGDQRHAHRAPPLFAGQIAGARSFGQSAQAAPDVQFPGKRRAQRGEGSAQVRSGRYRETCQAGTSRPRKAPLDVHEGVLIGARNAELRARFLHTLRGNAQIEVVRQGGGDHLVQGMVGKQILPFSVGDRCGHACGGGRAAEPARELDLRTLIVGPHHAAREGQ